MSDCSVVVISVVHRRKYGLQDHANALTEYGLKSGGEYIVCTRFFALVHALLETSRLKKRPNCIFWDNSFWSYLSLLFSKLVGAQTFYYLHEPGGIGQKLFKGDPFVYSLMASFAEWLMKSAASNVLIPRADKLADGDFFAPLLYLADRPHVQVRNAVVGFLGARRKHRMTHVFERIAPKLQDAGYEVVYFPSNDVGNTYADKVHFLSSVCAIWNCYAVPYNQSGVTGDCVFSSVPCIVSKHEPSRKLLSRLGLLIELDIEQSEELLVHQLVNQLGSTNEYDKVNKTTKEDVVSLFGGNDAFLRYWLPLFERQSAQS